MELRCNECDKEISEKVAKYSADKFGKELCMACQKKARQKITNEEKVTDDEVIDAKINRNNRWDINEDFIVKFKRNINGEWKEQEFITANGLLEIAETQAGGIQSIEVTKLSPIEKGFVAKVRITMKDGRVFEDCASGTEENLKDHMKQYAVEMAITRARSRALRFGLNVDYCSIEELSE